MSEELPVTGLTVKGVRDYIKATYLKSEMRWTKATYFNLMVWEVSVLEAVPNINSVRKRNFRLYTDGDSDDSPAWWEATQGPMAAPTPDPVIPAPTFLDEARAFLVAEAKANKIEAGELIYSDNKMERATATVIDTTKREKYVIIKRLDGKFSMEEFTPITKT